MRVGVGYDIHRLVEGRPLILAGLRIPFEKGCLGHSDGDVVLHAVADALLGAAGLPDIGELFPDTDPANKDLDSRGLLADVYARLRSCGFTVGNVDIVIHAERPKMSPYKRSMAEAIAGLLGVESSCVNVKAKTNESLGPIGNLEAMACTAVALIRPIGPE